MIEICSVIANSQRRAILATVVHVEGHSYRKKGVSMLLMDDGTIHGSISPGCIENDLAARVQSLLNNGLPELVVYDMRPVDDLSWGENIGCGGLLHILLEPVAGAFRELLLQMYRLLEAGRRVVLSRSYPSSGMAIQYHMSAPDDSIVFIEEKRQWEENLITVSIVYEPKPRLIMIGAGNDAIPVARLATSVGFDVTVADWREELCNQERFPTANLVVGFPREVIPLLQLKKSDYILIMSHQFQREREFIQLLPEKLYSYIGIMGSQDRTKRLLDGLHLHYVVHSPVGLQIGADGPTEIAISIVAELIEVKRNGGLLE
ncbi:XdhC family protein [Paenibacillus sediminis]|nr:XdhC family protein [Paenibacillus sediminis]